MAKEDYTPTKRPAKRGRKSRLHNVAFITPEMRANKVRDEFLNFYMNIATEAEQKVIGHMRPYGPNPENLMNEARRLLGESIARCKLIQFPLDRVRKSAGSAAGLKPKIGSVTDLHRGV